jgi:type II secretory pathway pseudopilin PulG
MLFTIVNSIVLLIIIGLLAIVILSSLFGPNEVNKKDKMP